MRVLQQSGSHPIVLSPNFLLVRDTLKVAKIRHPIIILVFHVANDLVRYFELRL